MLFAVRRLRRAMWCTIASSRAQSRIRRARMFVRSLRPAHTSADVVAPARPGRCRDAVGSADSQRELFAAAGDSARAHYDRYRAITESSRRGVRVGRISLLGAVVLAAASRNKVVRGFSYGLLFVSYGAGHIRCTAPRKRRASSIRRSGFTTAAFRRPCSSS